MLHSRELEAQIVMLVEHRKIKKTFAKHLFCFYFHLENGIKALNSNISIHRAHRMHPKILQQQIAFSKFIKSQPLNCGKRVTS